MSAPSRPVDVSKNTATPPLKEWVTRLTTKATVKQREKIIKFLLWEYGGLLLATMLIFYLQGFRLGGFNLDIVLLKLLCGATIGEIGGLLLLTFKAVFKG